MRVGNKVSMSEEEATPHGRKLHSLTTPPFAKAVITFKTKKNYLFLFRKKKGHQDWKLSIFSSGEERNNP